MINIIKIPSSGKLTKLPETIIRVNDLWTYTGYRPYMTLRQDLRCPCGSAYTQQSDTHVSCHYCKRVWTNEEITKYLDETS